MLRQNPESEPGGPSSNIQNPRLLGDFGCCGRIQSPGHRIQDTDFSRIHGFQNPTSGSATSRSPPAASPHAMEVLRIQQGDCRALAAPASRWYRELAREPPPQRVKLAAAGGTEQREGSDTHPARASRASKRAGNQASHTGTPKGSAFDSFRGEVCCCELPTHTQPTAPLPFSPNTCHDSTRSWRHITVSSSSAATAPSAGPESLRGRRLANR